MVGGFIDDLKEVADKVVKQTDKLAGKAKKKAEELAKETMVTAGKAK